MLRLAVFVSVVNSNHMSSSRAPPHQLEVVIRCCPSSLPPILLPFALVGLFSCVAEMDLTLAFPGVLRPLCFVFFNKYAPNSSAQGAQGDWNALESERKGGGNFFLINGSGLATSLALEKQSREVGVGNIS